MKSAKSEVFLVNKSNARSMRLPVLLLSFLIHFILLSHSPPRSDCSHYFFRFLRLVLNASQPNNGCIYNLHILHHYPVRSSSGRYLFQSPTELAGPLCSASLQSLLHGFSLCPISVQDRPIGAFDRDSKFATKKYL